MLFLPLGFTEERRPSPEETPHLPQSPEAFPTEGAVPFSSIKDSQSSMSTFGCDHSLFGGVKAVEAKDGVSHVRLRPMRSPEVVGGTHWYV